MYLFIISDTICALIQRNCLIRNSSTQLQELIQNAQMNNQQALQNQHHVLATQMAYKNKNNDFCSDDVGRKNHKHLMVSKCRAIGIVGTTFLLGFLLGGILAIVAYASQGFRSGAGAPEIRAPKEKNPDIFGTYGICMFFFVFDILGLCLKVFGSYLGVNGTENKDFKIFRFFRFHRVPHYAHSQMLFQGRALAGRAPDRKP